MDPTENIGLENRRVLEKNQQLPRHSGNNNYCDFEIEPLAKNLHPAQNSYNFKSRKESI